MKLNIRYSDTIKIPFDKKTELLNLIHDLSKWQSWSPWVSLDPNAKVITSENVNGQDTVMEWNGKFCGAGKITRIEANENEAHYDLQFFKPFKSNAKTSFYFRPGKDQATEVEWTMNSSLPFFMFFMRKMMEKIIIGDYRRGLRRICALVEQGSIPAVLEFIDIPVSVPAFKFLGARHLKVPYEKLPQTMSDALNNIQTELAKHPVTMEEGYCFYPKVDMVKNLFSFFTGHAFSGREINNSMFETTTIPDHRAIKVVLKGSYNYLEDAWSGIMMHSRGLKLKPLKSVAPYEKYIKHYGNTKNPQEFLTEVYFPVKD